MESVPKLESVPCKRENVEKDGDQSQPPPKRPKQEVQIEEEAKIPADFLCSICQDILVSPCLLPCGHSICQQCTDTLNVRNCPECRKPFKTFSPNIILRNFLLEAFPVACRKQQASLLNGWEIDHCEPLWRRWIPMIVKRMDASMPITAAQCARFVTGTTVRLITGISAASPFVCSPSRRTGAFGKPARDDLVLVMRKSNRVYIMHSTSKQFLL